MTEATFSRPGMAHWSRRGWTRFCRNRAALVSLVVLLVVLGAVLTSSWWWAQSPTALTEHTFAPPSREHWLGTDSNGRDMLARICAGTKVSLGVGIAGAGVSLFLGVLVGGVAGYAGGRWDAFLMRGVDLLYSLPSVILVIVLIAAFHEPVASWFRAWGGAGAERWAPVSMVILGLGIVSWLTMARIVRGEVRSLRHQPFVEASRALGGGHLRLLGRHILPNAAGVILVSLTLTLPSVVLGESFLSFLGIGIQPPEASLGSLIADGAGQINPVRTYGWLLWGPVTTLGILLVSVGFIGDGLRDVVESGRRTQDR